MDIDVEAREESIAEGLLILCTHGETPVPTVAVEPHLEVLRHTAVALGTDSSSFSIRWAMEGLVYIEMRNSYYYDVENDGTGTAVEIKRPRDETKDFEDEDTSEEDTSGDEETSEEDDNGNSGEPSRTTLHSGSTHRSGGASIDTSYYDYHPGRSSSLRQSSDEPTTTTEGPGQEHEHNSTEGEEAHKRGNRTVEMNMEQVLGAEAEEPQSSPWSNTVHLSQPCPEHMDVDIEAHEESVAEGLLILCTHGETHVPTVAVEPHLEVLRHTSTALGTDSSSFSFR